MMTSIGIIEKEESIVYQINSCLDNAKGYRVAFSCASFREYKLLSEAQRKADVLFIGVVSELEGLTTIGKIKRRNAAIQVIVMHTSKSEYFILKAVRAGAIGFLHLPFSREIFEECLVAIIEGRSFLCSEMQRKLFHLLYRENPAYGTVMNSQLLTGRENDIVRLLLKGYTNKEIGDSLFISHHTVNEHLKRVFRKLNVNSRGKLINKMVADINLHD